MISSEAEKPDVHFLPDLRSQIVHTNSGMQIFRWCSGGGERPPGGPMVGGMRYFKFYCLSHMYSGRGIYVARGGNPVTVEPGNCVFVSPGTVHFYGPLPGESYYEDTVNFIGAVPDMLLRSGVFRDGVFDLGSARRLLPVFELAADPSEHAQLNANFLLQKLIYETWNKCLQASAERPSIIDELLIRLREEPERWWTVKEMSEFCNLSDDQLRRLFLRRTGTLPKIYVDRLKLTHAAADLSGTGMSISEIASKYGYADPFHFSRRFKLLMGFSPARYRREADRLSNP